MIVNQTYQSSGKNTEIAISFDGLGENEQPLLNAVKAIDGASSITIGDNTGFRKLSATIPGTETEAKQKVAQALLSVLGLSVAQEVVPGFQS